MIKKQLGLTAISWLIVIGLVGIQAVMALRIIPVYMNYGSAKSILDSIRADPDVDSMTQKEIRRAISNRLQVNNLSNIAANKDAFIFSKTSDGLVLTMSYEERGPILGNLDFVATFEYEVILPSKTY